MNDMYFQSIVTLNFLDEIDKDDVCNNSCNQTAFQLPLFFEAKYFRPNICIFLPFYFVQPPILIKS
jgi:hypothetical protein